MTVAARTKQKFQVIELGITGAGSEVSLSKTTEVDHDEIIGVALYKNGGTHGHGTLKLKIDGEEIFPQGSHADIIMLDGNDKNIVLKDVLWPVSVKGKGSTIQIEYKEPEDGGSGKIWLYLLANQYQNKENQG
jgi:hypothetical protein